MSVRRDRRVVVAMSGGVDSSVAACLLHEQGYDVTGLFMRTGVEEPAADAACPSGDAAASTRPYRGCCSAADASDARAVAGRLGIPFFALNFKDRFDEIIQYFADEYSRGRTPNPCVLCNEHLKFGRLVEYASAAGADLVATGHYARIEVVDGVHRLRRGADPAKDQSYVLFGIARSMLPRTRFPIGGLVKDEVREHARRFGLTLHDKPESQDICFAPDRDYARVVRERRPDAFTEGPILDASGAEIGRHAGTAHFTIGQRRGLNVAAGVPIYVTHIDPGANAVVAGPREALAAHDLTASRVHWLVERPVEPVRAAVRIRYAHEPARATITPIGTDRVGVRFDEAQFAVTPGQAAVFYDGELVLGGGWIDGK